VVFCVAESTTRAGVIRRASDTCVSNCSISSNNTGTSSWTSDITELYREPADGSEVLLRKEDGNVQNFYRRVCGPGVAVGLLCVCVCVSVFAR